MNDKVIHEDADGKVFSTKKLLADKSAFGVVDTLQPNARLNLLIDTARTFRAQNPERPVMATELAVNEVLRLRKHVGELACEIDCLKDSLDFAHDNYSWKCDEVRELQRQLRPWWVKLAVWVRLITPVRS